MQQEINRQQFSTVSATRLLHGAGTVRLHPVPTRGKLALAFFSVLSVVYFAFRIPLWNPQHPFLATLLLAAEAFGSLTLVLHVISTWCLVEREAPPPPAEFEADIFITTWNESVAILRHTILAARQVRFARNIWLLDDGNRPEMVALASELEVKYLTREDRSHAKAGNINNALAHTDAPFIALFDCDHAPSPELLERTLGYFLDPSVAFVQTPQDFYNIDSFQHRVSSAKQEVWHEQTLFYRVIQAGKDFWNATFFCGSCAVLRREALLDIGGIATGTITEDMHTSLRLHQRGWSAVYHPEALAFGLSPVDLEQYETQRLRWGRGAMQVWRKERILTASGLTFAQRIAYFTSAITYFEGWQKAVVYLMPIVVLLTGWMPIIWPGWKFLSLFSAWLISGVLVNEVFSRGYSKSIWMEQYNFLRFLTFMRATLTLVVPLNWSFSVTPKNLSSTAFPVRLWPQMLVATAAILALPIGAWLFETRHHLPYAAFVLNLLWTAYSATLALLSVRFAIGCSQQRRCDHRFLIPLLARIAGAGGDRNTTVVAEDVSSNGFSFSLDSSESISGPIEGVLLLPSGPLGFAGLIVGQKPDLASGARRIAIQFQWLSAGSADPLNACLYGNTLQWDVNGWTEMRSETWTARALRLVRKAQAPFGLWSVAHLRGKNGRQIECAARREGDLVRVLAVEALPSMTSLSLTGGMAQLPALQVAGYRAYSAGGGTIHMAVLSPKGGVSPMHSHREPSWMRERVAA